MRGEDRRAKRTGEGKSGSRMDAVQFLKQSEFLSFPCGYVMCFRPSTFEQLCAFVDSKTLL